MEFEHFAASIVVEMEVNVVNFSLGNLFLWNMSIDVGPKEKATMIILNFV